MYDDPVLDLNWPLPVTEISDKDRKWALLEEAEPESRARMSLDGARSRRQEHTMIIVDNALRARAEEGRPIRVGMIGAGFMAQGLTNQIVNSVPGMGMAAVYNRRLERALDVFRYAGSEDIVTATTQNAVDDAIRAGRPVGHRGSVPDLLGRGTSTCSST